MKPKWMFVAYENKSGEPLISKGQENVTFFDSSNAQKNTIEIYIFEGPMRRESLDIIRASIEGSKYSDEAYLVYPRKRHDALSEIFKEIFENAFINPLNSVSSKKTAREYFERAARTLSALPSLDSIEFTTYELSEESTEMTDLYKKLTDPVAFLDGYQYLSEEMQSEVLDGMQTVIDDLQPSGDRVKRLFRIMQGITEKMSSGESIKDALESIVKGIEKTFGDEQLAAAICGFDENKPKYYEFDHDTYVLTGKDKLQKEFMKYPPRHGMKKSDVDGKDYPGTASVVMETQRYKRPGERPVYINDVIKHWKEWMPPLRNPKDPNLASTAYIPLIVGKKQVGIIIIQFSKKHEFTPEEKSEVNLYAKTAASVLYNAQLQKSLSIELDGVNRLKIFMANTSEAESFDVIAENSLKVILDNGYDAVVLHLLSGIISDESVTFFREQKQSFQIGLPPTFSYLEWALKPWEHSLELEIDRPIQATDWCLGYSLQSAGEFLGLLMVIKSNDQKHEVSPFSKYDKIWMSSVSQQITYIINELIRSDKLAKKSSAIANLALLILKDTEKNFESILEIVSEQLSLLFKFDDFLIAEYSIQSDEISYQKLYRDGEFRNLSAYKAFKKGDRKGILEYIIDTKQTIYVSNGFEEKLRELGVSIDPNTQLPKCYLGLPIISRNGETYGVIALQNFKHENMFSKNDKAILESIAALLSLRAS